MRITAYAKILDAEAVILFHELEMNFTLLVGRVKEPLKSQTYTEWLELESIYLKRLDELLNFAMENKYFLAVSNLVSAKIRWNYKKIFHTHLFNNWKKNKFDLTTPLNSEDFEILTKDAEKLDKIAGTYQMLEHRENMISCLNNKYEVLHFLRLWEQLENTKKKILEIIEQNDFSGLKEKYNEMIKGKTPHQTFIEDYSERINGIHALMKKCGIPVYKDSEELFLKRKAEWSIDTFLEFDLPFS
jgi:hypothetical protein